MKVMITLFTNIPKQYFDMLNNDGIIVCDITKSCMYNEDKQFSFAYDWLKSEFIKRKHAIELYNTKYFPIWTFYKYYGKNSNEHFEKYDDTVAQLTLQYDESDVLLSDFDLWHSCLNECKISLSENEDNEFDAFIKKHNVDRRGLLYDDYVNGNKYAAEARDIMLKSWNKIFDLYDENEYICYKNEEKRIQGNVKCITKKDVVDIKYFR